MKFTEEQMKNMASPISQTEDTKCKNALKMVRDALKKLNYTDDGKEILTYQSDTYSYALDMHQSSSGKKIMLLVQGSYANKTNIPSESDVDVAVILESDFTTAYRHGVTHEHYDFSEGTFSLRALKDEVLSALNQHFDYKGVVRHDKCIKVTGNSYRVDADVVPAYRYRDYTRDFSFNPLCYEGGIEIRPDSGGKIINYPEQHIKLGIVKNKETNYNFKKCVRIIKIMREHMDYCGYEISSKLSSFGLESLLWNVDISSYTRYSSTLRFIFDEVVTSLKNDSQNFGKYLEVNGIKPLFADETTQLAYTKFVTDLHSFYDYDI